MKTKADPRQNKNPSTSHMVGMFILLWSRMEMGLPVPGPGLPGGRGGSMRGSWSAVRKRKRTPWQRLKQIAQAQTAHMFSHRSSRSSPLQSRILFKKSNGHLKNWNGDSLSRTQNINKTSAESYKLACLKTLILPCTITGKTGRQILPRKR